MAESVVSFAVEKLLSFVDSEAELISGLPREIEAINNELGSIKVFLKDAEKRAEEDDAIKEWVRQVRNIAYRIEDSIDEYMMLLRYDHKKNILLRLVVKAFGCVMQLKPRHDIASTIKEIKAEIHEVNRRRESYQFKGISEGSFANTNKWQEDPRVLSLYVQESELVGVESPKREMIRLMDLERRDEKCSVISVVGMGGIGKTTVVRRVFADMEVRKQFNLYAWITVSHSYRRIDLLKSLLKQLHKAAKESTPRDFAILDDEVSIIDKLRNYLEGKRYLVVLDDVWDVELWMCIKSALPNVNNGSKILITTRLETVALAWKASSADHIYNLRPLAPQEAWDLFCKKTFQENGCLQELEELSQDIVRKCEGLPLAILAIGALLSTKRKTVLEWKKLRDCIGCELGTSPYFNSIRRILLLSYHELPYYLKPCFLYFGIFPEDYSVEHMRLIRLWIAEGFVKQHRSKTLEEVAEEYLKELVQRSLIQVSQVDRVGKAKSFRVHDILRDLILSKLEELSFCKVLSEKDSNVDSRFRRLSIHNSSMIDDLAKSVPDGKGTPIRSFFLFSKDTEKLPIFMMSTFLKSVYLLKVLDLQGTPIDYLPIEIGKLYHLRYLSVRNTKVKALPSSIGQLRDLQTLDLKHSLVLELPIEIKHLKNLRHLFACHGDAIGLRIPEGVLRIFKELQSLDHVDVSRDFLVDELKNLKQLRCLGITGVKGEDGLSLCNALEEMKDLESLSVGTRNADEIIDLQYIKSYPPLLESLSLKGSLQKSKLPFWIQNLNNLSRLRLRCSKVESDPLEFLKFLPNLVELNLAEEGYEGEKLVFGSKGFRKLKMLRLHDLRTLRWVFIETETLPLLQELRIEACLKLESVPSGIKHLSNLTAISFSDMASEFISSIIPEIGPQYCIVKQVPNVYIRTYDTQESRWKSHPLHEYKGC